MSWVEAPHRVDGDVWVARSLFGVFFVRSVCHMAITTNITKVVRGNVVELVLGAMSSHRRVVLVTAPILAGALGWLGLINDVVDVSTTTRTWRWRGRSSLLLILQAEAYIYIYMCRAACLR